MKIAFDEHVPTTIAKVFISLAKEKVIQRTCRGIIVEKAEDYAPKVADADYLKKSDVPWLDRFARAGGKAIISGDAKMRRKPHERLALYDHGFVVIFFEPQWAGLTFFRKSSLLLHWWEEITNKLRVAERGTFWAVPSSWPLKEGELKNVSLGLAQLLQDSPNRVTKIKQRNRAETRKRRAALGQQEFTKLLEMQDTDDQS